MKVIPTVLVGVILAAVAVANAAPFQMSDGVLGKSIAVEAGRYAMSLDVRGTVWQTDGKGWESDDRVMVKAYLNSEVVGSAEVSGMTGQNKTFHLPLDMVVNADSGGEVRFEVISLASNRKEVFRVTGASLNAEDWDGETKPGRKGTALPVPEAATMVFVGLGLAGVASTRKFLKR
jgi:hypothetical protein